MKRSTFDFPNDSAPLNSSLSEVALFAQFKWDFNSAQLFAALLCGIFWCTYLTFYNSRVFGFVLTKLINRFLLPNRHDYFVKIGSISASLLSGKIIFREFVYADCNFTVRAQDGVVYFRYWLPYKKTVEPKLAKLAADLRPVPPSKCRISVQLNGLECHVYNLVSKYVRIGRLFNMRDFKPGDYEKFNDDEMTIPTSPHFLEKWDFRCLVPIVHISISSGRFAFGNKFVPSTMTFDFENANSNYLTTKASNEFDLFMHIFKGSCENVKLSFVKTPDYYRTEKYEKPPRIMGEGFVILQTSSLSFYHCQDEVAIVPLNRRRLHYVTDDVLALWCTNFALGKGTVISYGPWADAQRQKFYKFFYPDDYQVSPMTPRPGPGKRRLYTKYEAKVNLLHDATLDVLFMREDVPNAMHINFVKGSWCEFVIPWRVDENGSATTLQGQLLMLDSSTSLEYRHFLTAETLTFSALLAYPRSWFDQHCWEFAFKSSKARLKLLYAHKEFLQDLINEWTKNNDYTDLAHFVPFTYSFDLKIDDFQLLLPCNSKNWIDTSSQAEENSYLSLAGSSLSSNFCLPFTKYRQIVYDLKFWASGENLSLKFYLPDQHVLKHGLQALYNSSNVVIHGRGSLANGTSQPSDFWRRACKGSDGWFDCGFSPAGTLSFSYAYHALLIGKEQYAPSDLCLTSVDSQKLNLSQMESDLITIDIEIGPTILLLTSFLEQILKESYGRVGKMTSEDSTRGKKLCRVDLREFRPLRCKLSLTLHDIQAHCLTHGFSADSHCPVLYGDQFLLEIDKRFSETLLQLSISPVYAHNLNPQSKVDPGSSDSSTVETESQLILTAFQLRGHGLFSAQNLPIDAPTAEYAWMMEFLLGRIEGRATPTQLAQILAFVHLLVEQLLNEEDWLVYPKNLDLCQHMRPMLLCGSKRSTPSLAQNGTNVKHRKSAVSCDSEMDLKYKFTRFSIDDIDLFIMDQKSAVQLAAGPVRFATCTEHLHGGKEGGYLNLGDLSFTQLVKVDHSSKLPTQWLECGKIRFSSPICEFISPWSSDQLTKRVKFQTLHDNLSRRLFFLHTPADRQTFACGCFGNCRFYGANGNGKIFGDAQRQPSATFSPPPATSVLAGAGINGRRRRRAAQLAVYDDGNGGVGVTGRFGSSAPTTSKAPSNDAPFGRSLLHGDEPALRAYGRRHLAVKVGAPSAVARMLVDGRPSSPNSMTGEQFFDSRAALNRSSSGASSNHSIPMEGGDLEKKISPGSESISFTSTKSRQILANISKLDRSSQCTTDSLLGYSKFLSTYNFVDHSTVSLCGLGPHDVHSATSLSVDSTGFVPSLSLCKQGLNEFKMVHEPPSSMNGPLADDPQNRRFSAAFDQSGDDSNFTEFSVSSKLHKISFEFFVSARISAFFCPLSVELLGRLVEGANFEKFLTHPARVSQNLFLSCSRRCHRQHLVDEGSAKRLEAMPVFRLNLNLPVLELCLFDGGFTEPVNPPNSQQRPSAPASCLLFLGQNFYLDSCLLPKRGPTPSPFDAGPALSINQKSTAFMREKTNRSVKKPDTAVSYHLRLSSNAELDACYFQVMQLVDHGSTTTSSLIALPRNASCVPYETNWFRMRFSADNPNFTVCCIADGVLRAVYCKSRIYPKILSRQFFERLLAGFGTNAGTNRQRLSSFDGSGTVKSSVIEDSTAEIVSSSPAVGPNSAKETKWACDSPSTSLSSDCSSIELTVESLTVKCGLGRPLETAADAWFLHDLLSPAVCAWVRALRSAVSRVGGVFDRFDTSRKTAWLFLLTEAMDLPKTPVTRSKFETMRVHKDLVRNCPTCQLCLCLLRYCTDDRFGSSFERRLSTASLGFHAERLNDALVALLVHWREILCAENLVQLAADRASTTLRRRQGDTRRRQVATSRSPSSYSDVDPQQKSKVESASRKINNPSATIIDIEPPVVHFTATASSDGKLLGVDTDEDMPPETSYDAGESKRLLHGHDVGGSVTTAEPSRNRTPKAVRLYKQTSGGLLAMPSAGLMTSSSVDKRRPSSTAPQQKTTPAAGLGRLSSVASSLSSANPTKRSATLSAAGQTTSARSTGNSDLNEDLYTWMARQQELERNQAKSNELDSRQVGFKVHSTKAAPIGREINPFDLSLDVFFDVFYTEESLIEKSKFVYFLFALGDKISTDVKLTNLELILVEPKLLQISQANGGFKRVTHIDRPLLILDECLCKSEAIFQTSRFSADAAQNFDSTIFGPTQQSPSSPLGDESSTVWRIKQDLTYDVQVKNCALAAGFAGLAFLNELSTIVRSIIECAMETERIQQDDVPDLVHPLYTDPKSTSWSKKLTTILKESHSYRQTDNLGQVNAIPVKYSKNFTNVLHTKVSGTCKCHVVELSAIFTELFVNAVINQLEFGHSFGHICDLSSLDHIFVVDPKSSRTGFALSWQKIDARLSEACPQAIGQQSLATLVHVTFDLSRFQFDRILNAEVSPQTLHADRYKNNLAINLGPVLVDIPLDPGFLHEAVLRGQKNLAERFMLLTTPQITEELVQYKKEATPGGTCLRSRQDLHTPSIFAENVVHVELETHTIDVKAALLPSLRASYGLAMVRGSGATGSDGRFVVDVARHWVIFDVSDFEAHGGFGQSLDSTEISPRIELQLPAVRTRGAYVVKSTSSPHPSTSNFRYLTPTTEKTTNLLVKEGGYLHVEVFVGALRHTLTTDRLNQFLFIQEAFTRELFEIVRKIVGDRRVNPPAAPTPSPSGSRAKGPVGSGVPTPVQHFLLYSVEFKVECLQITATTPTSTAIRLESDRARFQLSNRFLQKSAKTDSYEKVFGVAEINLTLSLGQLFKHALYEELEPEFQQFATFKTQISMRNVASHRSAGSPDFSDGQSPTGDDQQETSRTYTVNLKKPLIFVLPSAVDKALILWMNYRNTYEYWNEQRAKIKQPARGGAAPNRSAADRQYSVFEQIASVQPYAVGGPMFFQVAIDDGLYVVMPLLNPIQQQTGSAMRANLVVDENTPALLISLEKTSIAVCSSSSLVCRGNFKGFCVRLVEDFDASIDAWRPHSTEKFRPPVIVPASHAVTTGAPSSLPAPSSVVNNVDASNVNICHVSAGTYEICSRTSSASLTSDQGPLDRSLNSTTGSVANPRWILNVDWKMKGLDMTFNTRIGKLSSLLIATLTSFVADSSVDDGLTEIIISPPASPDTFAPSFKPVHFGGHQTPAMEVGNALRELDELSDSLARLPEKSLTKGSLEAQMREQAKLVSSLIQYGASEATIEIERRKLQRFENALYAGFKQGMADKLRYQSQKASLTLRDHIGLPGGPQPSHERFQRRYLAHLDRASSVQSDAAGFAANGRRSSGVSPLKQRPRLRRQAAAAAPIAGSTSVGRAFSVDASTTPAAHPSSAVDGGSKKVPTTSAAPTDGPPSSTPRWTSQSSSQQPAATTQPSIDLYLDLKIYVDSGQCTFKSSPPKTTSTNYQVTSAKDGFPGSRGKYKTGGLTGSLASSLKSRLTTGTVSATQTVIALPGLNVKTYYASQTNADKSTQAAILKDGGLPDEVVSQMTSSANKKGQFFMCFSLERMPVETVVSTHILDFLEQALEPVRDSEQLSGTGSRPGSSVAGTSVNETPPSVAQKPSTGQQPPLETPQQESLDQTATDPGSALVSGSIPIDVIIYLNVQSSNIRFVSQPASMVECVLRLPQLRLVATSKKPELTSGSPPTEPTPPSGQKLHRSTSGASVTGRPVKDGHLSGGISVTIILNGFSLFVYHPYNTTAINRLIAVPSSGTQRLLTGRLPPSPANPLGHAGATAPTSTSERRDALSLSITEIVIDMTRSRNVLTVDKMTSSTPDIKISHDPPSPKTSVQFSLLVDVRKADFKQDVRRLSELLSFLNAWYRRAISRRLFFGDESSAVATATVATGGGTGGNVASTFTSSLKSCATTTAASQATSAASSSDDTTSSSEPLGARASQKTSTKDSTVASRDESGEKSEKSSAKSHKQVNCRRWEAVVLFGLNFNELTVDTAMGQAMGSTGFKITGAVANGHVELNSEETKDVFIQCGMDTCQFDAKQGVVGGFCSLEAFEAYGHARRFAHLTPEHRFGVAWRALTSRVDWMSNTTFMGKVSKLTVDVRDSWTTVYGDKTPSADRIGRKEGPTRHQPPQHCYVRLYSTLDCESTFLMITKTTVSDFMRIYNKLYAFFQEQLNKSRSALTLTLEDPSLASAATAARRRAALLRVSATLHADDSNTASSDDGVSEASIKKPSVQKKVLNEEEKDEVATSELNFHKHWQKSLELITKLQMSAQQYFPVPAESTVLGGTFELDCRQVALACFHQLNFASPHWVVFYLLETSTNFTVEAKDAKIGGKLGAKIDQNLTFRLGKDRIKRHQGPLATVLRVSRNGPLYPPQGSTVEEWLSYAFTAVLTESHGFSVTASKWTVKTGKNDVVFLFKLPALRVNQRTEHLQPCPDEDEEKDENSTVPSSSKTATSDGSSESTESVETQPVVYCALVADFDGYLLLSQEIDALVTLADLVRSYLAEKQPVLASSLSGLPAWPSTLSGGPTLLQGSSGRRATAVLFVDPTQRLQNDARKFVTKLWQVTPQINFITLGERTTSDKWIKVDKILERGIEHIFGIMGFTEPSQTIPKWVQRGCMDPLDSLMANFMERILLLSRQN